MKEYIWGIDEVVSVIIPAYNRAYCIGKAIESVQNQLWSEYEIIVVDDGSTDDTIKYVKEMQAKDPSIRLIRHDTNRGVSAARNTGIAAATGAYVALLDSDDVWGGLKLIAQYKALQNNPSERRNTFCVSYYRVKDINGKIGIPYIFYRKPKGDDWENLLRNREYTQDELEVGALTWKLWFGIGSTLFAHRDAFAANGPFKTDLGYGEDTEYVVRHMVGGGRLAVVPELLMTYASPEPGKIYRGQEKFARYMIETYRCAIAVQRGPKVARAFVASLRRDNRLVAQDWQALARKLLIPAAAPCLTAETQCALRGKICRRHATPDITPKG